MTETTTAAKASVPPGAVGRPAPTMRAVAQHRYGGVDTLTVAAIPRPTIGPDEVLVEVAAAGVDRGVWHLMTGRPWLVRLMGYGLRRPVEPVLGMDVAGVVAAVGDRVTRFRPGDRVLGIARGAFAEYAVAEEEKLVHQPDGITSEQAAVSAISGGTALQAVEDAAAVQPGHRVLVIGASGGVGTFAVQLAVANGGIVTGVASTAKLDLVRELGATHVIDHTRESIDAEGVRYDVVIDVGGRNPLRRLRRVLAPTGTLVIVGGEGGNAVTGGFGRQVRAALLSPVVRQHLVVLMSREHHTIIERVAQRLADGTVVPAIDRTVTLAQVPAAITDLEAGHVRGKIAVRIGGEA